MHRDPRLYDHHEEPASHRHVPRHEPLDYRGGFENGPSFTESSRGINTGPNYHSTETQYHDTRSPSRYLDRKIPDRPLPQNKPPGKRRGSHYMDDVGSYYHSTHNEHHSKQNIQKQIDNPNSNHHPPNSKNHDRRSIDHHKNNEQKIQAKPNQKKTDWRQVLREELFQLALQPFSTETGTPYPCSQADIDFHRRNVFPNPNKGPFIPCRESTKEIMWQNGTDRTVPPTEKTAIKNLRSAVLAAQKNLAMGPDLAIKAFTDLDLVFFGGRLRNHVTVAWKPSLSFPEDPGQIWGICIPHRSKPGFSRIQLNAHMIFKEAWSRRTPAPFESMIGTLLHEMCHAYEQVRSPQDWEDTSGDGHGRLFGTRIAVVHARALRLLGLWAIERGEPHRQHHFLMPGCMDGRSDEQIGGEDEFEDSGYVDSGKNGAVEKGESRSGKFGSSDKRADGKKKESSGKRAEDEKAEKKRREEAWKKLNKRPKGTVCVIM